MYFDWRLWQLTRGMRWRIVATVLMGLTSAVIGVARFVFLGSLLALVFRGAPAAALLTAGGSGRGGRARSRVARARAHHGGAPHRCARAGGLAPQALRQGGRARSGLVRRRAHRRRHALGGRRRGAVADLFRPIRAAARHCRAHADRDVCHHRLVGRAGGGAHALLRAASAWFCRRPSIGSTAK